jgi:hypothetical protein
MSDDLETIATFNQGMEAELAKASLEREGIQSFVADQCFATFYGSVQAGGIKLMVRSSEAQRARTVLEAAKA